MIDAIWPILISEQFGVHLDYILAGATKSGPTRQVPLPLLIPYCRQGGGGERGPRRERACLGRGTATVFYKVGVAVRARAHALTRKGTREEETAV